MRWVQVFTGGPYRDWSVAVEPMTCGPDAFNAGPTHDDLIVLEPGEVRSADPGESAAGSRYRAVSVALDSRTTVTLIWPG